MFSHVIFEANQKDNNYIDAAVLAIGAITGRYGEREGREGRIGRTIEGRSCWKEYVGRKK